MQFDFGALLPIHSNDASLGGKRVERGSVALSVAPNNENFPANIVPERIQESVTYLAHKFNWDAELLRVSDVFEAK